jgi:hypothetical protein
MKIWCESVALDLAGSGWGSCEHDNVPSDTVKGGKFPE